MCAVGPRPSVQPMVVIAVVPTWVDVLMVCNCVFKTMIGAVAFSAGTDNEVMLMGGATEYLNAQDWAQDECDDRDGRCGEPESHGCVSTIMAIRGQGESVKMTILAGLSSWKFPTESSSAESRTMAKIQNVSEIVDQRPFGRRRQRVRSG